MYILPDRAPFTSVSSELGIAAIVGLEILVSDVVWTGSACRGMSLLGLDADEYWLHYSEKRSQALVAVQV